MANQSKSESDGNGTSCVGFFAPRTDSGKKYWNKFCWLCHREKPAEKKKCEKCYHMFHVNCLETNSMCIDCKVASMRGQILNSDDRKMLKLLIEKLFFDEEIVKFDSQNHLKPLTSIKEKIEQYTTFAAFLDDIKWMVHKNMVVYNEENKTSTTVERIQMYCVDQVASMQACSECHLNSEEWPDHYITKVCKMAHPILWAWDKTDSLFWPAKCMSVNDSKVTVRLFGYHKLVEIDLKDCWLYSRQPPTQKNGEGQVNADDLLASLKEADAYIENLQKQGGGFVYAASDTPFDPIIHFRASGKVFRSEHQPTTMTTMVNAPNIVSSTPLIGANSACRTSSHPLTNEAASTIQFKISPRDPRIAFKQIRAESTHTTPTGKKRKANDTVESPPKLKARKSFPESNNVHVLSKIVQMNFSEYIEKASRLCNGIELLERQIDELRLDKNQMSELKRENDTLRAENKQLSGYIKHLDSYWAKKLQAVKKQQWCETCGKTPSIPFHCSTACQKVYWKKQVTEPDDL